MTADPQDRVRASDLLPNMTFEALDINDGEEVVDNAFVLLRCSTKDGAITWSFRTAKAFNREELLGALTIQTDLVRKGLVAEWDVD